MISDSLCCPSLHLSIVSRSQHSKSEDHCSPTAMWILKRLEDLTRTIGKSMYCVPMSNPTGTCALQGCRHLARSSSTPCINGTTSKGTRSMESHTMVDVGKLVDKIRYFFLRCVSDLRSNRPRLHGSHIPTLSCTQLFCYIGFSALNVCA